MAAPPLSCIAAWIGSALAWGVVLGLVRVTLVAGCGLTRHFCVSGVGSEANRTNGECHVCFALHQKAIKIITSPLGPWKEAVLVRNSQACMSHPCVLCIFFGGS